MGIGFLVMGALNDRFGPRIIMAAGIFVFSMGYLLMSRVGAVWQLYLFYPLVGLGNAATEVVILPMLARWFVKKRGTITGIAKTGTGLGILTMPLLASFLIAAYDWRSSYLILGILVLVTGIPLSQLLRHDPAKMGLMPDGETQETVDNLDSRASGLSFREAARTRQLWITCGIYVTILFGIQVIMVHIVPYAIDNGIAKTSAAGVIAAVGGASILGRLVMGYTGDRLGSRSALIICFISFVAAFIWLQFATELWMLYLFAVVYGFCHGGFIALISPFIASLFGTRAHGVLLGTVLFSGTIGGSIGPLMAGYVFDVTGSYRIAFLVLLGLAITGLILSNLLKPIAAR